MSNALSTRLAALEELHAAGFVAMAVRVVQSGKWDDGELVDGKTRGAVLMKMIDKLLPNAEAKAVKPAGSTLAEMLGFTDVTPTPEALMTKGEGGQVIENVKEGGAGENIARAAKTGGATFTTEPPTENRETLENRETPSILQSLVTQFRNDPSDPITGDVHGWSDPELDAAIAAAKFGGEIDDEDPI